MRTLARTLLICLLAPAAATLARDAAPPAAPTPDPANPLSAYNRVVWGEVKSILIRSADKMPEESYTFKPTDAVRSFGQILGHVADAQYLFCSVIRGEANPNPKIEQTKTSKTAIIAALKDAFAYCDKAYDSMTDASAGQTAKLFGRDVPKLGVLGVNNLHNIEHYGNLITYMRLKSIVPPTSEPRPQPQPKK